MAYEMQMKYIKGVYLGIKLKLNVTTDKRYSIFFNVFIQNMTYEMQMKYIKRCISWNHTDLRKHPVI